MSKETEKTSTFCRICGRLLTVPESVKREVGPVCWGRLQRKGVFMPSYLTPSEAVKKEAGGISYRDCGGSLPLGGAEAR